MTSLPLRHQGKVRDSFDGTTTPRTFLIVATDGLSTHNVVHKSVVPGKGQILTAMTVFWATEVFIGIPHHVVAFGKRIYDHLPRDRSYPPDLHLRSLVVKELKMSPHEFVERWRMGGSLWTKYYSRGLPDPYGLSLPPGLQLMSPLDPPAFTPTNKSDTDDPENSLEVERDCPEEVRVVRAAHSQGRAWALRCGFEILDAKAEVGRDSDGVVRLGDEFLTGDCCRIARASEIVIGKNPPWADKEIFRQDAERQWGGATSGPPLEFSDEVIKKGMAAYSDVFEALSGSSLQNFWDNHD